MHVGVLLNASDQEVLAVLLQWCELSSLSEGGIFQTSCGEIILDCANYAVCHHIYAHWLSIYRLSVPVLLL